MYGVRLTGQRRQREQPSALHLEDQIWRVNWKDLGYPYCGIYVITTDAMWPCKIGISQNPIKRLNALQIAHWRPLQISGYFYLPNMHEAKKLETATHRRVKGLGKNLSGEWFDMRVPEAIEHIQWAALELNSDIRRDVPKELRYRLEKLVHGMQMDAMKNVPCGLMLSTPSWVTEGDVDEDADEA
jgi:hypothetical protein